MFTGFTDPTSIRDAAEQYLRQAMKEKTENVYYIKTF